MKIFSIRDVKAEAFNRPFFSQTRAMAMREIEMGLQTPDNNMAIFAPDFAIYELGEFDPVSGIITAHEPHHVIEVSELMHQDKPDAYAQAENPS